LLAAILEEKEGPTVGTLKAGRSVNIQVIILRLNSDIHFGIHFFHLISPTLHADHRSSFRSGTVLRHGCTLHIDFPLLEPFSLTSAKAIRVLLRNVWQALLTSLLSIGRA
jgi:hypothetical protein